MCAGRQANSEIMQQPISSQTFQELGQHVRWGTVVLDLHCGVQPQTFFRPHLHICCEPHGENVHVLQQRFAESPHVVVMQGEAQNIVPLFPDRSVDTVFLTDVPASLSKEKGHALLRECARIARQQIIIRHLATVGPDQDGTEANTVNGASMSKPRTATSGWCVSELEAPWRIFREPEADGTIAAPDTGRACGAIRDMPGRITTSLPMKVAVLSPFLPPHDSGQAIMLGRLFRDIREEDYILASSRHWRDNVFPNALLPNTLPGLHAQFHGLPSAFQFRWPRGKSGHGRALVNAVLLVVQRVRHLVGILKHTQCSAIIACSGDMYDLPVGYLASRCLGIPFYAYLFDYYSFQWALPMQCFHARYVERIVLRSAAGVIVPNAGLGEEYRRRYGVKAVIIHNPCDDEVVEDLHIDWPASPAGIRLVYTGQVWDAHFDALRNLIDALEYLNRNDIALHIYSGQRPEEMKLGHLDGAPVIFHHHVPAKQAVQVQRRADILFLPLAFHSPYPEVIDTSLPSKTGEYLASGRPVLVHAPASSIVSRYFKQYECGVVVDERDPVQLALAIRRLIQDAELRARCVRNARRCARTDFSLATARERLATLLRTSASRA